MRLLASVCTAGTSVPRMKINGRTSRHPRHRGNGENAEMKMYLSKLKDLVPFTPKHRKLSKLEIIQHAIDYICDLQTELENHSEIDKFEATTTSEAIVLDCNNDDRAECIVTLQHQPHNLKNFQSNEERLILVNDSNSNITIAGATTITTPAVSNFHQSLSPSVINHSSLAQRQPLIDRNTPNTILLANNNNTNSNSNQRVPYYLSPVAVTSTTSLSHLLNGNCTSTCPE